MKACNDCQFYLDGMVAIVPPQSNCPDCYKNLMREIHRLKAENEMMREGLEFYACRFSWDSDKYDGAYLIKELDRGNITYTETDGDIFTDVSGGKKARDILAKIKSFDAYVMRDAKIKELEEKLKVAVEALGLCERFSVLSTSGIAGKALKTIRGEK